MELPTLGTDPEIVAVATSADALHRVGMDDSLIGMPMPAYFAMGTATPLAPDVKISHGNLRPDGMALEFTVDPTNDVDTIVDRIRQNILDTAKIARDIGGCKLSVEPNFYTDPAWIARLPETYGPACSLQILGCAPDFSVYGIEPPQRPDPKTYTYRTSGGHIHIQIGSKMLEDRAAMAYTVAALDMVLGTAATYLCNSKQAYDRKRLYGQAGMVRANYGLGTVEYRTLPAQALVQTPELARLMFNAAQQTAFYMMRVYDSLPQMEAIETFKNEIGSYNDLVNTVVPAINDHDVDTCRDLQEKVAVRLSDCATISAIVHDLQSYRMPGTFDVLWGQD